MSRHQVHDRRVASAGHAVLQNGAAEDVPSGSSAAAETSPERTTKPLRCEAVIRHAHAFGPLCLELALQLLIRSLKALVRRVEILDVLCELLNSELHLFVIERLLLDKGLLFLVPGRRLSGLSLQPFCFVL